VADVDAKFFPEAAVKAASRVPAYALVFINLLIVLAVATQVQLAMAIVVAVVVLILSIYAIWVIELRSKRSVATTSVAQTERLQEVRDLDAPIRVVLDQLVDNEGDVYVVYSSTEVKEFVNQLGETIRPDDLSYGGGPEKWVTTIPDARAVARIHNLLYLGGKRQRLQPVTSWPDDFRPEWWEDSLILIGSGKSNRITTEVLRDFNSPYRFSDDFDTIIDVTASGSRWPEDKSDLRTMDYGIVVKLKVERSTGSSVYLVIAGIGPYGTLAGCAFLANEITTICNTYKDSPFAYIVSVKRDALAAFSPAVERTCPLPVIHR
jgi:hypothetical protein